MRIPISDNDRTRVFQVKDGNLRKCSSLMSDILEHSSVVNDEFTLYRDPIVYTAIFDFLRLGDFTFESYNHLRRIRLEAEYLCFDALICRTKTKLGALTVNANGTILVVSRHTAYPLLRDAFDMNECALDECGRIFTTIHCDMFALLKLLTDPVMETTMKEKEIRSEGWIRRFRELRWMLEDCAPFAPWKSLYEFAAAMPWFGSDALYTFVTTPDLFRFGHDLYMPVDDFKSMYTEFRRANEYERIRWTKDHYDDIFTDLGIDVRKTTLSYDGCMRTAAFVMGMDIS